MSEPLQSAMEYARGLFARLDMHWTGSETGMNRLGYSEQEQEAIIIVANSAIEALGLECVQDIAGNHYMVYPGASPDNGVLMMGSHLDAVPNGGRYDGPSGVIAGLAAVHILREMKITPHHNICVPIWRAEEGPSFGYATLGSSFATGRANVSLLGRTQSRTGKTLESQMTLLGLSPAAVRTAAEDRRPIIPINAIAGAIEHHIEQSTTLDEDGTDVGVVTGLRGYVNYPHSIHITGEPNHTGTAQQHRRIDPVRIGSAFVDSLSAAFDKLGAEHDLVYAFPVGTSGPMASSCRIAPGYRLKVEARSLDPEITRRAAELVTRTAHTISERFHTTVRVTDPSFMEPTSLSEPMAEFTRTAATAEGITLGTTISGAVHDAGTLQKAGVPATMIVSRHGREDHGQSHWPTETLARNRDEDPFATDGPYAQTVRVFFRLAADGKVADGQPGNFMARLLRDFGGQPVKIRPEPGTA